MKTLRRLYLKLYYPLFGLGMKSDKNVFLASYSAILGIAFILTLNVTEIVWVCQMLISINFSMVLNKYSLIAILLIFTAWQSMHLFSKQKYIELANEFTKKSKQEKKKESLFLILYFFCSVLFFFSIIMFKRWENLNAQEL